MQVSLSLVNSPILPEYMKPRVKLPSVRLLLRWRYSAPNFTPCFPCDHEVLLARKVVVSRRLSGAPKGAPKRAKGNRPSSVGSVPVVKPPLKRKSDQPAKAPFSPGPAPPVCASIPLSKMAGMKPLGMPNASELKFLSCEVSSTAKRLYPVRSSVIQAEEKLCE